MSLSDSILKQTLSFAAFEAKDEPGFEPTEIKSETQNLPPNQSSADRKQLQALRAENEDLKKKLEVKASIELNLADEVMSLKTELSRQAVMMSSYEDEKRNFEKLSSEHDELQSSSTADIQRLKAELEESSAANLELESRLISLSEKCADLDTSRQTNEAEISELRSEVEQSRSQTEGLQEMIRKKNVLVSQMKINEERSELELKKFKKLETDFKAGSDRFKRIKNSLVGLFSKDESFCSDVASRDDFKDVDSDEEICEVVEHVLAEYVEAKQRHLDDLQNHNKSIRDLKTLMQQKDQRFLDLTNKFNGKIDEVRSRIADVKKLSAKLESINSEKVMAEKREEAMKGKLESAKNEFADFQIGTKKLLRDLKSSIDLKNQKINELEKAKPVKADPMELEKQLQKISQLQLIAEHLKKKLAESKFQSSKLLSMVDVLQRLVFVTDEKASTVKQLMKQNEQLKQEAAFQNEKFGVMIKKVSDMSEKVRATMARNEAEVKQLNLELMNRDNLCQTLQKELESRNLTSCLKLENL